MSIHTTLLNRANGNHNAYNREKDKMEMLFPNWHLEETTGNKRTEQDLDGVLLDHRRCHIAITSHEDSPDKLWQISPSFNVHTTSTAPLKQLIDTECGYLGKMQWMGMCDLEDVWDQWAYPDRSPQ